MLWHAQILLPTCSPKVYTLKTREKMQNSSQKNIKKTKQHYRDQKFCNAAFSTGIENSDSSTTRHSM